MRHAGSKGLVSVVMAILAVAGSLPPAEARRDDGAASAPSTWPVMVDLRPKLDRWGLGPQRQGARNTCSVFTTTAALEFAVSQQRGRGTHLSVEYLNWACNQIIGNKTHDRGQFFHDLLKGFDKYGICLAEQMPYRPKFDGSLAPSEEARGEADKIRAYGLEIHWINPWKPQAGLTEEHMAMIKNVLAK